MYVRLEKPVKLIDGSWHASAELVNMDNVTRVWVEKAEIKGEPFFLLHLASDAQNIGRYYFGPADMRRSEQETRLTQLHTALNGASKIGWSMRKDHEAREFDKTKPLPDANV